MTVAPPIALPQHRPIDVIETFGPFAGMLAAMDRLGGGMPCGVIVRFERRSGASVKLAVAVASRRFPVLQHGIGWIDDRAVLLPIRSRPAQENRPLADMTSFRPRGDEPLWHWKTIEDGEDTWLAAVWTHAAADGLSMLHFIEAVAAIMDNRPIPQRRAKLLKRGRAQPMATWLPRLALHRHLRYVDIAEKSASAHGVAWLTLPRPLSARLLALAHSECGSFAAWLAAVSCTAYCEQQRGTASGRVWLNIPVTAREHQETGNFGFGAGSLLMPVRLQPGRDVPDLAKRISRGMKRMILRGWDRNFDRLLGSNPRRHLRFAAIKSPPTLTVSWKGVHGTLGAEDGIRNVACFAASSVAHVSAHVDHNGLSLSLTSPQPRAQCEALLLRIAALVGAGTLDGIHSLDDLDGRQASTGGIKAAA